jgi:hypothetical protein
MKNQDPEALEQAKKMLRSDVPPPNFETNPDGTNRNTVVEDEIPSTEDLLLGLGAVITIFGVLGVASFKDKIIAAIKKAVGKGQEPTQPGMKETMHKGMEETMYNEVEEGSWMETRAGAEGEVFENEKLEEAVNRIKQILKY